MVELFSKTAKFVANKLDYKYNQEEEKNVIAYLKHIKNLPYDAKDICPS